LYGIYFIEGFYLLSLLLLLELSSYYYELDESKSRSYLLIKKLFLYLIFGKS